MDHSRLRSAIFPLATILCVLFRSSTTMNTRIVDGSKIDITEIPFMLSLRLNDKHICGASIISQEWALTAAHCVSTYIANVSSYSVRSGSSFKDSGGEIHNLTDLISHENYDDTNNDYDIAVFKIDPAFRFDKTTGPINLPGNKYIDDSWGSIAGWGYYMLLMNDDSIQVPGNVLSEHLRYAEVPKVDRNVCAREYSGRYEITPRQVCYGYDQVGVDSCKGDSGGPLYVKNNTLIGLISWGEDCAGYRSPGVYTTIFLLSHWITEKTGVQSRL